MYCVIITISIVMYIPLVILIHNVADSSYDSERIESQSVSDALSANILGFAIESDNKKLMRSTVLSLMKYNTVFSVTILDNENNPLVYEKNKMFDRIELHNLDTKEIPIYSQTQLSMTIINNNILEDNQSNENILVGKMVIVSTKYILERKAKVQLYTTATISFVFCAITSLLFFGFYNYCTKKAQYLLDSYKSISLGKKGIRLPEKSRIIEISNTLKLFNYIANKLDKSWRNIREVEKVNELKKNILQISAHELRTPVTSLKTYIDMAIFHTKQQKTQEALRILDSCFTDIESLDHHITSILCLSALEQNSLPKNNQWVNINGLFADINNRYSKVCSLKDAVTWQCIPITDSKNSIYIDYDLVGIIISNVIDNAIKYTNVGFVKVIYELENDVLIIRVHDTGIGLTKEEQDILMTAPKQLNDNITRQRDGWGFGIETIHKFTKFLDGDFRIQSAKDFGTKISIHIPVTIKSGPDQKIIEPEINSEPEYLPAISNDTRTKKNNYNFLNVLVIDNDPQHINQMKEMLSHQFLRRSDVQSSFCLSPIDAIIEIEDNRYDIIFIDYHMPKLDGLQLLKFIREEPNKCKDSYKIILTADTNIPLPIKNEMIDLTTAIWSKGITSSKIRELIVGITMKAV